MSLFKEFKIKVLKSMAINSYDMILICSEWLKNTQLNITALKTHRRHHCMQLETI